MDMRERRYMFFWYFSEDDVRVLASSSFQVFFGGFWLARGGDDKRNMYPYSAVGTYFVLRLRMQVVPEAHVERAIRTVHFAKMGS
jgi:hypothetical protein